MIFDMRADIPRLHVRTYSSHYKKLSTETPDYAAWYKAKEKPTLSDDEFHKGDDFVIELTDFRQRFDNWADKSTIIGKDSAFADIA